jgi:hypothetical protein
MHLKTLWFRLAEWDCYKVKGDIENLKPYGGGL